MNSTHEILDAILLHEKSVLATVIKVEGSAYRKEGATMVFTEGGKKIGVISVGCLETDLEIQALQILESDASYSQIVIYDMSAEDDLSWGRGAGCNGKIHVLLEKVDREYKQQIKILRNYLQQGKSVYAIKLMKGNPPIVHSIFVAEDGQRFGHQGYLSDQILEKVLFEKEIQYPTIQNLGGTLFIHQIHAKPRLFIFGAGQDVRPLAAIASTTGFAVNIWDWRPAYLNHEHFPDANLLENSSIVETLRTINFISKDSIIIMTHDFQKDKELLKLVLPIKQLSYLGILGPRRRTERLLDNGMIPEQLHSPVGLAIGADGPEEIAISILADLIRAQRLVSEKHKGHDLDNEKRNHRHLSSGG